MSFEQQVECEAKILRQEIRNLKASLNNVTQRLQRASAAADMQAEEVQDVSANRALTSGTAFQLQQQITANDDLQLILDTLRRELQSKLLDN